MLYNIGYTSQQITGYYGEITFNNVAYLQIISKDKCPTLDVTGFVDDQTLKILTDLDTIVNNNKIYGNQSINLQQYENIKKSLPTENQWYAYSLSATADYGKKMVSGIEGASVSIFENVFLEPVLNVEYYIFKAFHGNYEAHSINSYQKQCIEELKQVIADRSLNKQYYYAGRTTGDVASVAIDGALLINGVKSGVLLIKDVKELSNGLRVMTATNGMTVLVNTNGATVSASGAVTATGGATIALFGSAPKDFWDDVTKASGKANFLKFGDNDLVLGLNDNGMLQRFKQNGGKGYGDFKASCDKFDIEIKEAMQQADKIRFNLNGVDLKQITDKSRLVNIHGQPVNGYTNYELWKIKNTPEFLRKTVFYLNDQVIPASQVFK